MKSRAATVRFTLRLTAREPVLPAFLPPRPSRGGGGWMLIFARATNGSVNQNRVAALIACDKTSSSLQDGALTLVEVSEALLLLLHRRRGGRAQDVLKRAPPGAFFGHHPRFFVLQERRQGLSGRRAEGEKRS